MSLRTASLAAVLFSLLAPLAHAAPERAPEPVPVRVPAPAEAPVTDPVYIGWERACVVYRYSPAEDKWTSWKGPRALLPRTVIPIVGAHFAAALDPGAGYAGWLFDLDARRWTKVPPSPIAAPQGIMDPIAAAFVGSELVVWGAMNGDVQGAVLDTQALRWRPVARAPVVPRYRCVTAVLGSRLMVWGGYGPLGPRRIGPQEDGAIYDASNDAWTRLPPPPVPGHRYGCAAGVIGGRFVVFGGTIGGHAARGGMTFDPATGKWDVIPDAPAHVGAMAACAAAGDRLFVWSGTPDGGGGGATAEGAVYDLRTRRWTKLPEAPIPPRLLGFARLDEHGATVWGGWESSPEAFLMDGARYDFDKQAWRAIAPLPADVPKEMHPGW